MKFQYDVFLSYSSSDREWARKVNDSLHQQHPAYNTFFDFQSLRAGDDWEARIGTAVETAQHLILLWSEQAQLSSWVSRELYTFFTAAKPKSNANRRLIFINLQGMNQAMKAFQQINRPELQTAYTLQVKLADSVWDEVQAEIEDGLNPLKKPLPVPLAVLTLKRDDLEALSADRWLRLGEDFKLSKAFLLSRYEKTREDWRPFASADNISSVLDRIKNQVNISLKNHRLNWHRPDESFWTDIFAARDFVDKEFNTGALSVLVIDPVALYHFDIYQRLMLFQDSLTSSRTVIFSLPPFGVPRRILRLRSALMKLAMPYFDDYFQPAVPPRRSLAAQCGWNVSDTDEIQRLILAAAGQLASDNETPEMSAFIRHGSTR